MELEVERQDVQLAHAPALLQNWPAGQLAWEVQAATAAARQRFDWGRRHTHRGGQPAWSLTQNGSTRCTGAALGCAWWVVGACEICMQTGKGDHVGVLRHEGPTLGGVRRA